MGEQEARDRGADLKGPRRGVDRDHEPPPAVRVHGRRVLQGSHRRRHHVVCHGFSLFRLAGLVLRSPPPRSCFGPRANKTTKTEVCVTAGENKRYMEPFCSNLESFVEKYGDDGKSELNALCPKHQVELAPQDHDDHTKFTYGGLQIQDGVLRLLFAEGNLAVNVSDVSRDFHEALKTAAAGGGSGSGTAFNINARQSVREGYDPEIGAVQKAIGELVGAPGIRLTPNFEANAAVLAAAGAQVRDDWDKVLGRASLAYFDGLKYQLERAEFEGDDMLQDGFQEGVAKNEISLHVVGKLQKGHYHEVLVEDGVLVIQTTPEYFWTNTSDVGSEILEIL
ncbi:hypothetical protein CLAIMM_08042 isoform 2 [Cladophialophora immunda]|nr:hypothetical protein CLAIMM_08042 isoform 2 [Cladophialophora immunda]